VKSASRNFRRGRVVGTSVLRLQPQHLSLLFPLAAILLAATVLTGSIRVTNPTLQSATQQPLQVTTEIVKLDATVTDEHGEFVSGLQQKNFKVFDHDVEQPIIFFAPTDAPAQILVMIETGPAVYLIQGDHIAAVNALAGGLAPDDEIALVAYDETPRTILPFTQDRARLAAALGQIQYTLGFGDLNLFDSISSVLDSMAPATGKKAIVLLTTGLDSSPASRWQALVRKLRATDVVIFPVALGASLRTPAKKNKGKAPATPDEPPVFAEADKALHSLADITGGRSFFPESVADFAPMYREIAATLRHQYVLGIAPGHDGQFHALTLQVSEDGALPSSTTEKNILRKIFVREGYLAPGP
jgi:Ca-activated chloride channel homolog